MNRHGFRGVVATLSSAVLLTCPSVDAAAAPASAPATLTLTIHVPDSFAGCDALSPTISDADRAVLDLTRPSAFTNNAQDVLQGEGGAIQSAELVSLSPQTVVYGLNTAMHWSNGVAFSPRDLIHYWQEARTGSTALALTYRAIASAVASKSGDALRVTFRTPQAQWPTLFRDVSFRSVDQTSCNPSTLATAPSLGPYRVIASNRTSVTLAANTQWVSNVNRFGRVIITSSSGFAASSSFYVGYRPSVRQIDVATLALHPTIQGSFSPGNAITELQFSPKVSFHLRRSLSLVLNRSQLIRELFGAETTLPYPATSVLYPQGMPGGPGPFVPTASYVAGTNPAADCHSCAAGWLEQTLQRRALRVLVCVAPSDIELRTAQAVASLWRRIGVHVDIDRVASTEVASADARNGHCDVAVINRPTDSLPVQLVQSYVSGMPTDSFATKIAVPGLTKLIGAAEKIFNPTTANSSWAKVDTAILSSFAVRPLFTPPALIEWSGNVQNITATDSLLSLLDAVPNWTVQTP